MRKAFLLITIFMPPMFLQSCGAGNDEYENSGSGTSNKCQAKTKDVNVTPRRVVLTVGNTKNNIQKILWETFYQN